MANPKLCSILGCDNPVDARGWCKKHWKRWKRNGSPTGGTTPHGAPHDFLVGTVFQYSGADCLIWPFARTPRGYGVIRKNGRSQYVHRLVCEFANGAPPTATHEAAHSCGNGHLGCCSAAHLSWATHAGNMRDMVIHERSPKGSRQGQSKLTKEDVETAISLKGEATQREIADMLGVSRSHVGRILNGQVWEWFTQIRSS